jgi:hypothetical protein
MALATVNWNPTDREVRQFGLSLGGFLLLLAGWWGVTGGNPWVSLAAAAAGLLAGLAGLMRPAAVRYVQVGVTVLLYPLGLAVSYLVLAIIWYGLFTLVATIFRCLGRDALQRSFDLAATSYWQPKTLPTDASRYLCQF